MKHRPTRRIACARTYTCVHCSIKLARERNDSKRTTKLFDRPNDDLALRLDRVIRRLSRKIWLINTSRLNVFVSVFRRDSLIKTESPRDSFRRFVSQIGFPGDRVKKKKEIPSRGFHVPRVLRRFDDKARPNTDFKVRLVLEKLENPLIPLEWNLLHQV